MVLLCGITKHEIDKEFTPWVGRKFNKKTLTCDSTATSKSLPDDDGCGNAIAWLNDWNKLARDYFNGDIVADWNNNVDITEEHAEESKVLPYFTSTIFLNHQFREKIPSSKSSSKRKQKKPRRSFAKLLIPASMTSTQLDVVYKINPRKLLMMSCTSQ